MDAVWRDEGSRDVALVATCLANAGYRVTIRTAKGGGSGRTCFDNLRHCHILVLPDDSNSSDDAFIVDICFRSCARSLLHAGPLPFHTHTHTT